MYKEGYLRTASINYDTEVTDRFIHLTNNCLQKFGNNYGKHEDGNTLSYDDLQKYIDKEYPDLKVSVEHHILPRMRDLIIDTILSVQNTVNPMHRRNCFELFGYDFLIDEDFRTWLIEVNTNPYLGIPNQYISVLLPQMLDDMLKLIVDVVYPPKNPPEERENLYQLIYCEKNSSYSSKEITMRRPYNTNLYPITDLTPPDFSSFRQRIKQIKIVSKNINQSHINNSHDSIIQNQVQSCKFQQEKTIKKAQDNQREKIQNQKRIQKLFQRALSNHEANNSSLMNNQSNTLNNSQEQNQQMQKKLESIQSDIESIKENLAKGTHYEIQIRVPKLIKYLKNKDEEIQIFAPEICDVVNQIVESRFINILASKKVMPLLLDLLKDEQTSNEIRLMCLQCIKTAVSKLHLRKKMTELGVVNPLQQIVLTTTDEEKFNKYDKSIIDEAFTAIQQITSTDSRMYLAARGGDNFRRRVIYEGGITTLLSLSKNCKYEDIKQKSNELLNDLNLLD